MLPRWHILFGAIFTLIIWIISPQTSWIYLGLVFLSSFLIDFDHYAAAVMRTRKLGLRDSFDFYKKLGKEMDSLESRGIKKKGPFHPFHTVEFHLLVLLLSFVWLGFIYIFIGMLFHSLLDIGYMVYRHKFHEREFLFVNWLRKKISR